MSGRARFDARRVAACGAVLVAIAAALATPAAAQYTVGWYTIDGGGASPSAGGAYSVRGTVAQADPGVLIGGTYSLNGGFWRGGAQFVGVGDPPMDGLPRRFGVSAGPNPIAQRASVVFDLPQARSVTMRVYDTAGRAVRTLAQGAFAAGRHQRVWDVADDEGRRVPAGIYFVRVDAESDRVIRKVAVMK